MDLFQALLTRIELAIRSGDPDQVMKALDPAGTPFHQLRTGFTALWDRYFALVIPLLSSQDPDIARRAEHFLKLGFWFETPESASALSQRLQGILRAVRPRFQDDPELLLRMTHYLDSHHAIDPIYVELLDELERDSGPTRLPPGVVAAAKIAYVHARTPWDEAGDVLLSSLDHPEVLVRAYAARGLGERYHDADSGSLSPTLAEIIGTITEKELARPGIAGPLLSPYYAAMDLAYFEQDSGLDCKAWLLHILRQRKGPEPHLLPCSNGVDFFSHELFETPAELQLLVLAGALPIAVESAGDHGIDIKRLLLTTETENPDVLREIAGYLARQHRIADPRGVARNFVRVFDHRPEVDLFLVDFDDDSRNRTIAIFAKAPDGHLTHTTALDWVDRLLPAARRGAVVRTEPWDTPALRRVAAMYDWTTLTYANGAVVELRGSNTRQQWRSVTISWTVPWDQWNPDIQ